MFPPRSLLPFLALLIVVAAPIGIRVIRGGATPDKVRMPEFDLRELPLELGQWRGEKLKLDPKLFAAIDAEMAIDRLYRDSNGYPLSLHTAVFLEYALHGPHQPPLCYSNSGFEIVGIKPLSIQVDPGRVISADLMTAARDGKEVHVLFWYQLGPFTAGARALKKERQTYWGQPVWPPMFKVMLQDANPDASAAEARMSDLAKEVYRWMNKQGAGSAEHRARQSREQGARSQTP